MGRGPAPALPLPQALLRATPFGGSMPHRDLTRYPARYPAPSQITTPLSVINIAPFPPQRPLILLPLPTLFQDVCSPPLKPFFTRMNEALLTNQRQKMQKCLPPKLPPTAQLVPLRATVASSRARGACLMARQLNHVSNKARMGRMM